MASANFCRLPDKFCPLSEISQSLPIPEYEIGLIIGKREKYIKQLSEKSGATITISDCTSKELGAVWRYVQITVQVELSIERKTNLHTFGASSASSNDRKRRRYGYIDERKQVVVA